MVIAECDNCEKKLPCRFIDLGLNDGEFILPQFWMHYPTSHNEVVVVACSTKCANNIDLTRAINKAKNLAEKSKSFYEKK